MAAKFARHKEGDVVEQSNAAYTKNPRPFRLGKMYALWYNKNNEPRIIVGPDFGFSIVELLLTNGILAYELNSARSQEL